MTTMKSSMYQTYVYFKYSTLSIETFLLVVQALGYSLCKRSALSCYSIMHIPAKMVHYSRNITESVVLSPENNFWGYDRPAVCERTTLWVLRELFIGQSQSLRVQGTILIFMQSITGGAHLFDVWFK